jgi:hydrogenase maturation protease
MLGAAEEGSTAMRTLVLGMGSVLMRDDGVGPSALAAFASIYELPAEVELLDIGTPGPELAHRIGGYDALIIFDAIRESSPPGTVRCLKRNEILAAPRLNPRLSPHDPGIKDALLAADFFGDAPRAVMLSGIVPKRIELGTELSAEVAAALPRAAKAAADELSRLGIAVAPRQVPELAEVWWN